MQTSNNKPKKSFFKRFLITLAFFLLAIIVAGSLVFLGTIQPPTLPLISDEDTRLVAPERFTDEDRKELFYTFLLLGLNESINANTIMVISYDGVSGEANLVSIPRDSLVDANRRVRKINSAFPAGMIRYGGVEGGVAQMQREVMSVIGFVPDFYMVLDFDAFERIIDVVGGIEVYVPFHMRYDDPFQNLHINIPPGLHHMDGETALHFARYRRSNRGYRDITDYQRIENQQTVINATINNMLTPANILKVPEFIEIFTENVHTNLTPGNLLWFATQFNEIRGTNAISTYTVPTTGTSGAPMWYELLNGPGIVELVNRTINPFERDIELKDLNIIRH